MTTNPPGPEALVFGQRLRHLRKARGFTLETLGTRVGKPASFLSQLETGKREPRLSLIDTLAGALGATRAELLSVEPPSRRSQLEINVEQAQDEPLYQSLALPHLKPTARVPDAALEHIVTLYHQLAQRTEISAQSPEGARRANSAQRLEMRSRDNYFPEIEDAARSALTAVDGNQRGAVSERTIVDLAQHFGFEIRRVRDLPRQTRSVADLKNRTIYIPQRDTMPTRAARSVILQSLGHFALGHGDPTDFADHLRQQVEANYFAGAVLAPEAAAVEFLDDAKTRCDLSIEDLKEIFYLSYEMAAHRFTNLATRHLGLQVHFVRANDEGIIEKVYENDGIPFPTHDGVIEGQRVCRRWGIRTAFDAEDMFDIHYQYTETKNGEYWDVTYVETEQLPPNAVTVGVLQADARYFRGRETTRRELSGCPDGPCCRAPGGELVEQWTGWAWPLPRQQPHMLAAPRVDAYPGVELPEVFEFLDRRSAKA